MEDNKQQAILQFESGDYRGAFLAFRALYNASQDEDERQLVLRILQEGYYLPNEEELRENYRKNCGLLGNYPFQMGYKERPFDALPVCLFPVTEREYCLYDKKEQRFSELLVIESEDLTDYMFEHLDQPVFRENECDLYQLRYLWDNVRRSEDFGGDNHIYLYYSEWSQILPLLLFGELEPLLKDHKFVFLIGAESKKHYPLDFKKQFQIDYAAMGPQKLRIEEMKRICYWYKRGYSGSSFAIDVLDHNPYIIAKEGVELFYRTYILGYPLFQTDIPEEILKNISKKYSLEDIDAIYHCPDIKWGVLDMSAFIEWLRMSNLSQFTLSDLFRAYFIYKYHRDEPSANPRIVPLILWEPHLNTMDIHDSLVLSFPYRMALNIFRDPVQTAGRIYQVEGSIYIPQIMWIGYSMNPELQKHYYSYRFEDLKLHPAETCKALCEALNVPYDPNMLDSDMTEAGFNGEPAVCGFDLAPLYRNIDSSFSKFDQVRLQIFYDTLLRHYGYPTFDFDECPMEENDVAFLMKFPFKCEKGYVESEKWEKVTSSQLRERLFQNMMAVWGVGKQGKLVLPKVIRPRLEEP